ncbi:hypothetical protein B7R22_13810, partial [Subtercola boreus]
TRINFFPGPDGVFFDVDLRELEVQRSVDGLSDLMRCLGTATGRNVVLRSEGGSQRVLRYEAGEDQFSLP